MDVTYQWFVFASLEHCDEEGFNIQGVYTHNPSRWNMNIRIGLVANQENDCKTCDSCIEFGTSVSGCENGVRNTTCGDMAVCHQLNNKITAAFGYTAISIKVVHERSGKVEYERERLLGIANKLMNFQSGSQQPFALVFDFSALLVDNLN